MNGEEKLYAKVAVDIPVSLNNTEFFYYSIPPEIKDNVKAGTLVHVPFGSQELKGFVLDTCHSLDTLSIGKGINLKSIYEVIYKNPIWNKNFIKLAKWISDYYFTNIGIVLSASVGADILTRSTNEIEFIENAQPLENITNEQQTIIDALKKSKKKSLSSTTLIQKTKLNRLKFYRLINQLKAKEIIKSTIKYEDKGQKQEARGRRQEAGDRKQESGNREQETGDRKQESSEIMPHVSILLNPEQEHAYNTILELLSANTHKTFLLHGVTGSGKTEVYFKLINEALQKNKSVIYLVPEIYLISQIYQRMVNTFDPSKIILWHSSLSKNQRLNYWESLQNKYESRIILGARSAILAPIENLGLIIVDEAHDNSYKQASPAPRYDAITTSIKRGEIENCPVVLGTATPNITEYYKCSNDKTVLHLTNRFQNVPMPEVELIDLANEYKNNSKNIISTTLKLNIDQALAKKEQIILLLNRRGYSSYMFCRACGFILYCNHCSVPLVYHKNIDSMVCHHCGFQASTKNNLLNKCPECKSQHFKCFGLGTQQLEEEVKKLFPEAKTLRVDSDQLSKKDNYIHLWKEFAEHKADILIGTQIIAKGLDLPNVTIVGVVLSDSMLSFPDYISYERAFQLLTQVTGRAGRGQKPGKVFIQTYQPENPLFRFIQDHDYKSFYSSEIKQREEFIYPPFTNLVRLIFQSEDETTCTNYANHVLKELTEISNQLSTVNSQQSDSTQFSILNSQFLGPAPCFFMKLNGKHRCHILCKFNNESIKQEVFNKLFQRLKKSAKVDLILDVDSVNLL